MPTWLLNIWNVYGEQITPVIVTLVLAIVTAIGINIKSAAKINAKKAEVQIEYMKKISDREDTTPQLETLSKDTQDLQQEIVKLKDANYTLAEIFKLAFLNSSLDEDTKSNIDSLVNQLKYGSTDNYVKELETSNEQLKEEIETLKQQSVIEITENVEVTPTRIRR